MTSELQKAIDKLVKKEPGWKEFLPKEPSPIPDSAGKAPNVLASAPSGGSGLTERAYNERTYHPRKTIRSTDGVLTFQFDPIKTVTMKPPNGEAVIWTFDEPTR